MIIERYNKRL